MVVWVFSCLLVDHSQLKFPSGKLEAFCIPNWPTFPSPGCTAECESAECEWTEEAAGRWSASEQEHGEEAAHQWLQLNCSHSPLIHFPEFCHFPFFSAPANMFVFLSDIRFQQLKSFWCQSKRSSVSRNRWTVIWRSWAWRGHLLWICRFMSSTLLCYP